MLTNLLLVASLRLTVKARQSSFRRVTFNLHAMVVGLRNTPSETDLKRVKAIRVETLSPWRGMERELSKASEEHIGWVIAANGKVYPHVMAVKSDKTTPIATLAYVGSGENSGHGYCV